MSADLIVAEMLSRFRLPTWLLEGINFPVLQDRPAVRL